MEKIYNFLSKIIQPEVNEMVTLNAGETKVLFSKF